MRKIVLLLLAAAGMTTAAYADQKISGRVTYSGDDSPLIGATIQPVGGGRYCYRP